MRRLTAGFVIIVALATISDSVAADNGDFSRHVLETQIQGYKLLDQKKFNEAEQLFTKLLKECRANPGERRMNLINGLHCLSEVYHRTDRMGDMLKLTEEANRITAEELRKFPDTKGMADGLDALTAQTRKIAETKLSDGTSAVSNGSMARSRESAVRGCMRTVQIAAESYAIDFSCYPTKLDTAFSSYFPGGKEKVRAGEPIVNVYSGAREWPIVINKNEDLKSKKVIPGAVIYLCSANGKTYSIYGVGADGKYINDPKTGKMLVFTATCP